ncbi:hypothetical protein E1B28_013632 [Marasmius oreades]|uniref:Uncharacterized protein n=1 Tax=Marasmius oreades TaxID=181124 RepID=A0A9P7RQ69_9AGAR|nr:uncharacterized protein E1B28_013632 [Marasmius oreades]KAG7087684.1 hypothetical protein E1B28_013632 [Marasmius oreades]
MVYLSSPASTSSSRFLEDTYSCLPSISCPVLLLPDSYSSCSDTRQPAYTETSSERRARLEFLQKEKNKEARQEDRSRSRVASWVQSQVENSAFMVLATAQQQKRRSKRRQSEPRIAGQRSGSSLRFSYVPSDDGEEEQDDIHRIPHSKCRPLSQSSQFSYTSRTPTHNSPPSSKRRRRTHRLAPSTSSLDSIPEE